MIRKKWETGLTEMYWTKTKSMKSLKVNYISDESVSPWVYLTTGRTVLTPQKKQRRKHPAVMRKVAVKKRMTCRRGNDSSAHTLLRKPWRYYTAMHSARSVTVYSGMTKMLILCHCLGTKLIYLSCSYLLLN